MRYLLTLLVDMVGIVADLFLIPASLVWVRLSVGSVLVIIFVVAVVLMIRTRQQTGRSSASPSMFVRGNVSHSVIEGLDSDADVLFGGKVSRTRMAKIRQRSNKDDE
jgi:hypothetical protein